MIAIPCQESEKCCFFCGVNDSIKYGPMLGIFLFLGKMVLFSFSLEAWDVLRSILVNAGGLSISLSYISKRNQLYFPYKVAWLSGFNIVVIASIVSAFLVFVFNPVLFDQKLNTMQALYYAFVEFITSEFIGVIVVTVMSFVFRKKVENNRLD